MHPNGYRGGSGPLLSASTISTRPVLAALPVAVRLGRCHATAGRDLQENSSVCTVHAADDYRAGT